MSLNKDIEEIKEDVKFIKRYATGRVGLYTMVFIAMLGSCYAANHALEAKQNAARAAQYASDSESLLRRHLEKYEFHKKNVLGDPTPEKFYEIDGRRYYLEIDGKPVMEYFKGE